MIEVLLVIAHQGFQPVEYSVPKRILEQAGIKVVTASNKPGTATAADNSKAKVDITLDKVDPQNYAGIFFIGGPGALENLDNPTSHKIINEIANLGKPFGAICISPRILAKADVLDGKQATGWNGDGEIKKTFDPHGVKYVPKDVGFVVDGKILTATCPKAAESFGQQIVKLVKPQK